MGGEKEKGPSFQTAACQDVREGRTGGGMCQVKGVLVDLRYNSRFVTFVLDDSTALLEVAWPYVSPQGEPLVSSHLPSCPRAALVSPTSVFPGAFLVARGFARTFRGKVELKATWVSIDRDPNAEAVHLLELVAHRQIS